MMKYLLAPAALLPMAFLFLLGCALTKPLDKAFSDALGNTVARTELDTLAYRSGFNFSKGASKGLLNDSTSLEVAALLDLLDAKLQRTSSKVMFSLTDSVQYQVLIRTLGAALSDQINNKVLGAATQQRLKTLRDELLTQWVFFLEKEVQNNLLGEGTRQRIAALRNELLGDSTRLLIRELRGELTNEETTRGLTALVNAALSPAIEKLDKTINQNLKVTQKYANEIIMALLLAAFLIVAWVWYQRRKYLNLVKLLTTQINSIPNQAVYDDLTGRIRSEAVKTSMEPALKEVLKSQGL
ncbi:MAG: hypothetical protein IT260_11325 [Saprospiraceae bacterium]|nr:hypothetical protein [Saprospiraceae bacterium]